MPCICYGAVSGNEDLNRFMKTEIGETVMTMLKSSAMLIKHFSVHEECYREDFYSAFILAFDHMLNGCNEKKREK